MIGAHRHFLLMPTHRSAQALFGGTLNEERTSTYRIQTTYQLVFVFEQDKELFDQTDARSTKTRCLRLNPTYWTRIASMKIYVALDGAPASALS
jgi:hypothetical protein